MVLDCRPYLTIWLLMIVNQNFSFISLHNTPCKIREEKEKTQDFSQVSLFRFTVYPYPKI